ncbi:nicotinate-nucleotide--dimethylbenzimidazole phosphoribosyltransferase [Saccharothrix deserti]|uniref:nicotinate-nucleotide--dimethylbenzimidazole phosphoribosyltransferase n=1 Tax=Saccharothrix deserti TaxID=2593674 RepID=UPI00131DFF98|nr:nicotinate-nucleotide--dimethylbenzimidazole phosphoribosyltransferase [Saccharothrix deserti]
MSAAPARGLRDTLAQLCHDVEPVEDRFARLARVRQLTLARPAGSLGALEHVIRQVAAVRRTETPGPLDAVVSVLAADHGVARRGTSAYPHGHTARVLELIATGRSPVDALARRLRARVVHADVGLTRPIGDQRYKVVAGTRDLVDEDAMSEQDVPRAIVAGARYTRERLGGEPLLAVGEIGVGNTVATAVLACRLLGTSPQGLVGTGSGIHGPAVPRKQQVVERALDRVAALPDDPLRLLAAVGGVEIAANVGVLLAAASQRRVIVLDGVITAVSALLAVRLCPAVAGYLVAGHQSSEPAHAPLLRQLGLSPLLRLDLHLGMASGAVVAIGVVNDALAVAALTPAADQVGLGAPR